MADVPQDMQKQIKRLEEIFTVPTAKLKEITEHFIGELDRGLSVEGGTIVCNPLSLYLHRLAS